MMRLTVLVLVVCDLAAVLGLPAPQEVVEDDVEGRLPEVVDYDQVKAHLAENTALVIDVRNATELSTVGEIPGSVNLPLYLVEEALKLNSEDFKELYKFEKPNLDDPVIFSCRTGRRSGLAIKIAKEAGYTNLANYVGSFTDWSKQAKRLPATVDYEQVKQHLSDNTALVIDVRNATELSTVGEIPGSVNLPLYLVEEALKLNSEDFKELYKFEKPGLDDPVIFSCRTGRRSGLAIKIAKEAGYTNLANYVGSFTDWSKQEKRLPATVDYEQVKQHLADNTALVIDVRNATELSTVGEIPGSVNLPLYLVEEAFGLDDEEFRELYKFEKPALDDPVIFSCRTGRRSALAIKIAKEAGYTNLANYVGSFTDWSKQEKRLPATVDYEQVKKHLDDSTATVVDVRNATELVDYGQVEGAVNIPLHQLEDALKLDNEEFEDEYQITKPESDSPLIFFCQKGARAAAAVEIAKENGFTNVAHYPGSYDDWEANSQQ